ncbi:hypothetical protein ACH5RR_016581 [Cinchona calisaya]|uniref:Uncharacterized protein n=1 Tax=Cinchona calisaya TaxID=153742 RepID=A0ABD2ZZ15_9GENT
MFALMAFAFQYIRPLRKLYKVEELSREMLIQTSFPLACTWVAKLIKTLKSSYPDVRLVQLNECLDNLKFDDIYYNPYERNFKRMPIHCKNQKQIGLAIVPISTWSVAFSIGPIVCWSQFELSKQKQIDMKDWLKSNVKAARKNVLLYCKGIKGRGNKNYWKLWKDKMGMDVMDARNQIHTQRWLLNKGVEQQELPKELPQEHQDLPQEQDVMAMHEAADEKLKQIAPELPEQKLNFIKLDKLKFLEKATEPRCDEPKLNGLMNDFINGLPEGWKFFANESEIWSLDKHQLKEFTKEET